MFARNPPRRWITVPTVLAGLCLCDPVSASKVAVSNHTVIVTAGGGLRVAGKNGNGNLGLGDAFLRRTFCSVGESNVWQSVYAGPSVTFAIQADGALWACGNATSGRLGLGDLVFSDSSTLTRVGTDQNWLEVTVGDRQTLARKLDGTLWVWGSGYSGELGLGSGISNQNTPVQLGTDAGWLGCDAGGRHVVAIKADGSLWSWGSNFFGQLGIGTSGNRYVPSRVGLLNDWTKISAGGTHNLAIRADGSLWAWGSNDAGKLGNGSASGTVNTPTQIGTGSTWSAVSAGENFSLAIKTDGSLWAWGFNGGGQLGLGDLTSRSAPTRVGAASDWQSVHAGANHAAGIRAGGAVWLWGNNGSGQLGAPTGNRLEPAPASLAEKPVITISTFPNPTWDGHIQISGQQTFAFPQTVEGISKSAAFTVFNHGSTQLQLSDAVTGAGFSENLDPPKVLDPGASILLNVSRDASLAGALAGSLTISSNDPATPAFLIHLSGTVFSFTADADGDELSDAAEFKLAAHGFRVNSADPGLLTLLRAEGHRAGLVSEGALRAAQPGGLLLKRDEVSGKSVVRLRLEKSSSLAGFTAAGLSGASVDAGGRLLVPQPRTGDHGFFRFRIDPPTTAP